MAGGRRRYLWGARLVAWRPGEICDAQVPAVRGRNWPRVGGRDGAFVRAWSHRGQLDRHGAPEAWVRATAWRIAVSRWHRARRGRLLLRSAPAPQVADGPTPDRVAFIDALRKVPGEQRRALVLYYVCDLSVARIAAETGVPDGTVKARLARGRAALAPYLRESVGQHATGEAGRGGPEEAGHV